MAKQCYWMIRMPHGRRLLVLVVLALVIAGLGAESQRHVRIAIAARSAKEALERPGYDCLNIANQPHLSDPGEDL
jgi:hypothetical protein